MIYDSGKTDSLWNLTVDVPGHTAIEPGQHVDVCVVGAGIAGMTTAFLGAREGRTVIVLDDGPIGGGETGRTTAHLSYALTDRYFELEQMHGETGARLAAESHAAAIDLIESIVHSESIGCDFARVDGYLFQPPESDPEILNREMDTLHRAGFHDVRLLDRAPLPGYDTGPCLVLPNQAQFHPMKYLAGLAAAIDKYGGRIYSRSFHVEKIEGDSPAKVTVRGGDMVTADSVVVATNTPVNDWVTIHTKQAAYRTYVICGLIPAGSVKKALFWDTADPYHYVRIQPIDQEHDALIVGGEDHKTGQADDTNSRFVSLERWARERFPPIESIEYRWSGQVMQSMDGLAFLGHNPGDEPNVYVATGDSGNGMTHGTIGGIVIGDLMQGRDNPWTELYDPSRKTLRAAGRFAKENLNVAWQYSGLLTAGDVNSEADVEPGCGAVIRRALQKVAIYQDEAGEVFQMSAICPHLGCVVDWNGTEKTWDCPCHGSRFDAKGKVINGPANTDLALAGDDEPQVRPIVAIAE